ncbi:MAG: hypothetical protein ACI9MF_002674 [Gammaproteobacteria bacterium]|jgi:hypothetical protein
MKQIFRMLTSLIAMSLGTQLASAGQFVIELDAPLEQPPADILSDHDISLDQTFSAGVDSYAVFSATDQTSFSSFLQSAEINAEKISEVLFVNSPTIGGGQPAASEPREGHDIFVIERPIPGVGFLGLEKKKKISQNSNAAIAMLGDLIEWDHSYLTSEGTYCIYRADSPDTIREHGLLAGAPTGKITPVIQQTYK